MLYIAVRSMRYRDDSFLFSDVPESQRAGDNIGGCSPDRKHYNLLSFSVPHSDGGGNDEDNLQAYVFPGCGHVYGYHSSLEHKPCPLCRSKGVFVPVSFALEGSVHQHMNMTEMDSIGVGYQSISSLQSYYVFNPCGHIARREVK